MQLSDVLCYIVLTITVTASCARAEEQNKEAEESQDVKRISKREATLIYDFDGNQMDKIFQKPKVIYRRISKGRFEPTNVKYGPPKARYGPPRPKHRPFKSTRKPGKKSRTGKPKTSSPKYGPPVSRNKYKSYPNQKQNKYNVRKFRPNSRPGFGHVVKMPHYSFPVPDKTSFGEPPAHKEHGPQKSYGEPPVDSYGAPLKPGVVDVYPTPNSFQDSSQHDDLIGKQEQQRNHNYIDNSDISFAFTKKEPSFSNFVTLNPQDSHGDSLAAVDKPVNNNLFFRKMKPYYFADSKVVNRLWKANKQNNNYDDEIIVGGQYAEPPARHITKNIQYSPIIHDDYDDEPFPNPHSGYVDIDGAQSANQSPYSNYKNSNMAFSPQNLNDAFSIVDK